MMMPTIIVPKKTRYGLAIWRSPTAWAIRTPMPAMTSTNTVRMMTRSMADNLSGGRPTACSRRPAVTDRTYGGGSFRTRQLRDEPVVELEQAFHDDFRLAQHRH